MSNEKMDGHVRYINHLYHMIRCSMLREQIRKELKIRMKRLMRLS